MEKPLVSVIMGVYNCNDRQMLGRSVRSVLEQTLADLEFIICDDGSDDDTYSLLCDLAAEDDRIRLIRNDRNMSLAVALNKCIDNSTGKYIARQDADDYSLPERLESQAAFLDDNKDAGFVGSACLLYDSRGVHGQRHMPEMPDKKDFLFNSPFVHGSVMFRREVLSQAGGYVPKGKMRKFEDYDLFMRLYEKGIRGANLDSCLYAFHHDDDVRSVSFRLRMDEAAVRYEGFRRLGLLPKGAVYLLKPVILAFIPHRLINRIKKKHST